MVNARLCETARQGFFFASSRDLHFLDCETKTLKGFECETLSLAKNRDSKTPSYKKTKLRDLQNSTKILRDPEFVKDHSQPLQQWSTLICLSPW